MTTRTWSHPRGLVDLDAVLALLAPDGLGHFVPTAAVSVENTHNFGGGALQSLEVLRRLRDETVLVGVGRHLDGARLWNAAVATGRPPAEYGALFDTVAVCLSKGLGAPIGSVVVGSAERIARARAWRARLGGGWRQAGVLAAAGRYALEHHLDRLADDHARARELAERLAAAAPGVVDPAEVQTNIVVLDVGAAGRTAQEVAERARADGVLVSVLGPATVRVVTHLDVDTAACDLAAGVLARILAGRRRISGGAAAVPAVRPGGVSPTPS